MPPIEIRIKRGTATYLAEQNFVLDTGEPCLEIDTGKIKYGDGVTPWTLLAYATGNDTSGTNNEVAGTDGFIGGGADNIVSGVSAGVVGGQTNTAAGARAVVLGGSTNVAAQPNAVVIGGANNIADGQNSVVLGGNNNLAEGANSVAFGQDAVATKVAQTVFAGGKFQTPGDAQFSIYHLRQSTDDAVPTRMYFNGTAGQLIIAENTLWYFEIKLTAYDTTVDAASVWSIRGGIQRDYNGAVQLVGPATVESWGDDWDATATVTATADNINKALAITVTGTGGHDIQWYATVLTSETTTEEPLTSDMFVDIIYPNSVTSLTVSVPGGGSAMYPTFAPTTYDYAVNSGTYFSDTGNRSYAITINGETPITGVATVNKCLRIKAAGGSYFVRLIPSDLPVPTISIKTAQYIPGYYSVVPNQGSPNYAILYDGNGVPVFYTPGHDGLFSLAPGWENNRLTTNSHTGNNFARWDIAIGSNSLTALPYAMINPDTRGGYHTWEIHESHSIRTPGRVGNIIYQSYDSTGFYIQEQNPQNQIVWEWWSDDYFNTTYADFFHINSIDVHPVTGDVVVSCRHPSTVFCIDYQTKNILWATQGEGFHSGPIQPAAKSNMTANTKWLTTVGEPTVQGYSQYNATSAQHDARWVDMFIPPLTPGNSVVSISDNQSLTYRPARGVIFEINMNTNQAIFRSHVYSTLGNTPYQGSFNVVKELNGLTSHFCNFPEQHPNLVEYAGDANGVGTQTKTLEMDIAGMMYRAVKVRSDFFNLNYLRTTAGRTVTVL